MELTHGTPTLSELEQLSSYFFKLNFVNYILHNAFFLIKILPLPPFFILNTILNFQILFPTLNCLY